MRLGEHPHYLSSQKPRKNDSRSCCSLVTTAEALDIVPSPSATQELCTEADKLLGSPITQLQEGASAAIIIAKLQCVNPPILKGQIKPCMSRLCEHVGRKTWQPEDC